MATPSKVDIGTVGPDNPLKIDILTNETINLSIKYLNLKPVTNTVSHERGGIPTIDGLYSDVIFGKTVEERKHQYGYVNLNTKIIHPFIYIRLEQLQQNISQCAAGEGCWKVTDDGQLVRLKDDDPDANPNNTGLDWLISVLPKVKFKRNKTRGRNERIDVYETFNVEDFIIDKFIIIPVFYRDMNTQDGQRTEPPINKLYKKLLQYSKSLENETVYFMGHITKFNILKTCVDIHKYFLSLIEKSDGFFHQYVVGKNPDYGCRSVISCMTLDQFDTPDEVPIDVNHCGLPLADVCVTLFPFILRWVLNYLTEELDTSGTGCRVLTPSGNVVELELDDALADYTSDKVKKRITKYIDNYESRFEPIYVRCKTANGSKKFPMVFAGRPFDPKNPTDDSGSPISNRPFTWTDLLYIAAVEVSEDKHTWVTRYPLISYTGIFPCRIHVLSTVDIVPMKLRINGIEREYRYYPNIPPNMTPEQAETAFNDTVNMDNSFLDAIEGDYDGDQISHRAPFSVEANDEAEAIIASKKHYIDCQGKMTRTLGNEAILCLYSMTYTDSKKAKPASPHAIEEIINSDYHSVGVKKLTEWFGYTTDMETKKIHDPKYRVYDTLKLGPNQYINKESVDTTLGLLAFNKICIEPYISKIIPNGYWNTPLDKKGIGKLFDFVANELKYDRVTVAELWPWLKAIQFYAYKATTIFSSSTTELTITPDKEIVAKRDKFFKEHPNATSEEVIKLEDELTKMLQEKVDNDSSRTLFGSGAKAKTEDQLKNINTMIGPVYNPQTGKFDVIKNSFIEGFEKKDIPKAGNMVISASYPKSVGTADAGYITKQFYAIYGGVKVAPSGTDCHTHSYLTLEYNEDNWKGLEGQNVMIDETHYETVTDKNYKKFINKPIKVRSPMCCLSQDVCSVCAGTRPYEMDMRNLGITFATVPNTFLNAGMKKFHTSKVKLVAADIDKLFI